MSTYELYNEINEEHEERLALVMERIGDIAREKASGIDVIYRDAFLRMADELLLMYVISGVALSGELDSLTDAQGEEWNHVLFDDVQEPEYQESYVNPQYAVESLGTEYGQIISVLDACLHSIPPYCMEENLQYLCIYAELYVEIYNCFEDWEECSESSLKNILYSFMHDNAEIFRTHSIETMLNPDYDYCLRLVMEADLSTPAYLYRYGRCVGMDEVTMAHFLQTLSETQIQSMADTFTEGYRIGFKVTGKDISKKSVVEIRYPIGFERMVRQAVKNFEKIGLRPVMRPFSISLNRQFLYDHKEDKGLWLDKAIVERGLEVDRYVWEKHRKTAPCYGGPAVIDVFGMEPFSPVQKEERVNLTDRQQELSVYEVREKSRLVNRYIHGEERSFTIIAYPVPSIGDKFTDIFAETVKINTLDYELYQNMQQKLIDVLDQADRVHIVGCNGNKTDLYVKIFPLSDPDKETAFENCVADVNIPVGEVFTSPVLRGTEGRLHVSQVYLNELCYHNLELEFKDGMIKTYTCTNFENEEKNRKYIEDNILFHHKTLPMGEFAIGTNTTAYCMAEKFDIADKLPILIAEKTGPHFAVGDTCYSYEEDIMTYNPDGKAIVARENDVSALRKTEPDKAYFNCHTDITIPYDELGLIEVVRADHTTERIIENGRFVVPGTEPLNKPLEQL